MRSGDSEVPGGRTVVAAFDKFRHTATAIQLCGAVGDVAWELGWTCRTRPVADGGEGTLDVLLDNGGVRRTTSVAGPLGVPVDADWLLRGRTAYIEMARASGLGVIGGAEHNRALDATTRGTGELAVAALNEGAQKIVIALGGSATTDGGLGALEAMEPLVRFKSVDLLVACDVETLFVDAARVFGPQKGASPAQVELLTRRLERLADTYERARGVDVRGVAGGGAAGGLAGGLVSIGGRLQSGFALIAEEVGLPEALDTADLVVTGEGFLDAESFNGKVVGGVAELARNAGVGVVVVCGGRADDLVIPAEFADTIRKVFVLSDRFGKERSWSDPLGCIRDLGAELFVA
jgi:glycerate 2-kinase